VSAATTEIAELIAELNDELSALYNADQRHGLALDALFQPHIRFFIARKDGAAMGCGGVALFDDFAEVKRMYVREAARGQGIAEVLMQRLEAEAGNAGFALLGWKPVSTPVPRSDSMDGADFQSARRSRRIPPCRNRRWRPAISWKSRFKPAC
jgi:GNAT superfamily N-acetyltransferase